MNTAHAAPLHLVGREGPVRLSRRGIALRTGAAADAPAIHALVLDHLQEGHLLPRELEEIAERADRFVVAAHRDRVVACAELVPLSGALAEVRSLVVGREARRLGLGRRIVGALVSRATVEGFDRLCAFTHAPAYFVHLGFSIVPHAWLPEKIAADCRTCAHFHRCGQYAVVHDLARPRDACVPPAALHG